MRLEAVAEDELGLLCIALRHGADQQLDRLILVQVGVAAVPLVG